MQSSDNVEKYRIDKWLFAARFFKTRSLAAEAIDRGRVTVNGQRVKPAKVLAVGDRLIIRNNNYQFEIEVLDLSNKRGSATIAQQLYRETEESRQQREVLAARLKTQPQPFTPKAVRLSVTAAKSSVLSPIIMNDRQL
jgi:ribosome-associated heat shock protein Hsp15